MFAHAVYVGDQKWNMKEGLDIIVTVSEELNIVVPANEVSSAVYIDVPISSVLEVSFDNALVPDSQQPTYGVVIRLDGGLTTKCILNATGCAEHHVAIAFSSQKDANTLKKLLMPTNSPTNGFAPRSRSGATEASEQVLSDDELAPPNPALSDNQMLTERASLDNALVPYGSAVSTINPSMLERVHPSRRTSSEHHEDSGSSIIEDEEDSPIVGYSVEMATEGIDVSQRDVLVEQAVEGIDVSQNAGLSHGENQYRDIQAHIPDNAPSNARFHISKVLGSGKETPVGRFDRVPVIGPSNLSHLHTDRNATENVAQLRAQPSQHAMSSVEQVGNRRGPEGHHEEHDELYYASPKVKNGHRRSPRILARNNAPKTLERPLESTFQRLSAKKGPPIKISRQLRNADGVVELHTELTVDDGLNNVTKNDAVDLKTNANDKKNKATVPVKVRNGIIESTKAGKKTAQSKGRGIVSKEPSDTSLDDYDLPASPQRLDLNTKTSGNKKDAVSTRLKTTKAPRTKQKKATPVLTKAATGASTQKSVPKLKNGLKNIAEAKSPVQGPLPNRPSGKKIDDRDDTIWDIDQAHSERERESLKQPRQPAKTAKKQGVRLPKSGKTKTQTQLHSDKAKATKPPSAHHGESVAHLVEARPAPAALSRHRPRRTAAIKANKKIQGLEESDEIVDDEEIVPALTRSKRYIPVAAVKTCKNQGIKNGGDDQRTPSRKLPNTNVSAKDPIPDSVSPDSSDKQSPDPVSDPKADSSPEKVNVIRDAPAEVLRSAAGDKNYSLQKEKSTSTAETSVLPLRSGHGDQPNKPDPISGEQSAKLSEDRVELVPDSVPEIHDPVVETESAPVSFQREKGIKQGHNDPGATTSAGPEDQNQAENFVPCADDGSLEINSTLDRAEKKVALPQVPTAPMTVRIREKRGSPQFAVSVAKSLPNLTSTRRDPFVTKLNASMPQPKDTSINVKSSDVPKDRHWERNGPKTTKPTEPERSSRGSKTKALHMPGAVPSRKTKQVESAQKRLQTAIQVNGEGKSPPIRSPKPAVEPISASRVDAKRKGEEIEDMSNKRAKVVGQGRLEGVFAKRKPGFDAKKTPPPVVSNKPVVIGFSASGPRNQGTISSKKSKPSNYVGTGTPDAAESRKYEEVLDPATNQVGTDLASFQETLQNASEDIKFKTKITGDARKEARASPREMQAEYLKTVNAVVTGEARVQENGVEKRKLAPFLDDPASWEHKQLPKRQKRDIRTPPNAQKHHPKMITDLSPALIHDRSQRLSSQNTRVNENGSPMPFFMTRNESVTAKEQSSDEDDGRDALARTRLEEDFVLQDDNPILPEPTLPLPPLVSAVSKSQPKARAYQSLSNNSKQVPSSPHASSAFGTMPPHHLYHDGEIVNAETRESIVPTKPQDPFLGATQKPPNSFMDALRKSTEFAAKRFGSGANDKRNSGGVIMRPNPDVAEDPDKTLVEPNLRKRPRQVRVSDRSSTSNSSYSTQASQLDESPEGDSEAEIEARWRKNLEPHHENMLDCLLTISHVSNELIILLVWL